MNPQEKEPNPQPAAATAPTPPKRPPRSIPRRRKRNLILATGLFAVIGLVFLLLYLLVWQHQEETDDAYVAGNLVQITAQVPGTVGEIRVKDTDTVKAGDVLLSLDTEDAQLAYESALDGLRMAARQYRQQDAAVFQAAALVNAKKTAQRNAQDAYQRRVKLKDSGAISAEELEHMRAAAEGAQADLQAALAQQAAARAAVGDNVPLEQQPAVLTAIAKVKQAWLNLQRTAIRAPIDGQIAKRNVEIGQKIAPGAPLMVIVPLHQLWVDANFKETQLEHMRIGQAVTLHADLYGSGVVYHGKIVGMSAGTGSAFSLLPPQNATGNWIKVVQRVPVRVSLDEQELLKNPLRIGLSMTAAVNTKDKSGKRIAAAVSPQADAAGKNALAVNFAPVEEVIDGILQESK